MERWETEAELEELQVRLKFTPETVIPNMDRNTLLETLYKRGVIPDEFAIELLQKMEQDQSISPLTYLTPKSWGCVSGTGIGEFYTRALSMKAMDRRIFGLCSIADAYRVAVHKGPEFRGQKFVLGMIPKMCSDKEYRTLTLNKDHEGVWVESVILSEIIDVEQPYLFRFTGDGSATHKI